MAEHSTHTLIPAILLSFFPFFSLTVSSLVCSIIRLESRIVVLGLLLCSAHKKKAGAMQWGKCHLALPVSNFALL